MFERLPFIGKKAPRITYSQWCNGAGGLRTPEYIVRFEKRLNGLRHNPKIGQERLDYRIYEREYRKVTNMKAHFSEWVAEPTSYIDTVLQNNEWEEKGIKPVMPEKPSYPLTYTSAHTFYHKTANVFSFENPIRDKLLIGFIRDLIKDEEEKVA